MKDRQENKLSMYRATELVLDDNNTIWNGVPAVVSTKTALSAKIVAIRSASQQQDSVITGIATDKKVLKTTLVDIAVPVSAAVIAYASQTNNNELLAQVKFGRSELLLTRDDLLGQRCQNIHDRANDNLVALTPFGITAAVLTVLATAITDYVAKVPSTRSATVNKKATTTSLNNLFKETDKILKLQLDKLILQFKAANIDFWNAYTSAREIIDIGSTTAKVRGTVKDVNDSSLAGVTFIIRKTGTTEIVGQTVTSLNGTFSISNLLPGYYDFSWSLANYTTKTQTNVRISAGKELQRKIVLKQSSQAILATYAAPLMASLLLNIGPWVNGTTAVRFTVTSGKARCSRSLDGTVVDGVPIVLMAPGTQTKAAEDFQIIGMHVVVENLSDSEGANVKVELLG